MSKLKERRKELRLTQKEIAEKVGSDGLVPYTACLVYSDDCVVLRQSGTKRTRKHRV